MASDTSEALRLFTQLHGLDDLPYLHYVARSIIRKQKFIIYLLSVLRFLISNSLNELRVCRDWLALTAASMPVSIFEIDRLIKNPTFLFRFSKQNYNYWATKFHSTSSVPTRLFTFKNQSDIEMREWDTSSDLGPISPHLHSLKDRFKKFLYCYQYSSWIRRPNYNPRALLGKYFNDEITADLEVELQISPMWAHFVGDPSVGFIDSLSAIVTGYHADGSPSPYLRREISNTRENDYLKSVSSGRRTCPGPYKLKYLNVLGAHILNYKAAPLSTESLKENASEHRSDASSALSSHSVDAGAHSVANIEFYKPPLPANPSLQNFNDENQQLFGW